ncbi:MAG: hypothetical protein ACFB2W_00965 [Leptolyngbyaceae cyanobacterium]
MTNYPVLSIDEISERTPGEIFQLFKTALRMMSGPRAWVTRPDTAVDLPSALWMAKHVIEITEELKTTV